MLNSPVRAVARDQIESYFTELHKVCSTANVRDLSRQALALEAGFGRFAQQALSAHSAGNSVIFIGNGGSASIASHQAIDYLKNGRVRAFALNDSAALTCLGNDYGYAEVFSKQLELLSHKGDMLVAISSSGRSMNILNAVDVARTRGLSVVTFSGFDSDNPLRSLGDVNFYIDSNHYGFVELAHLTLIHSILDICIIKNGHA